MQHHLEDSPFTPPAPPLLSCRPFGPNVAHNFDMDVRLGLREGPHLLEGLQLAAECHCIHGRCGLQLRLGGLHLCGQPRQHPVLLHHRALQGSNNSMQLLHGGGISLSGIVRPAIMHGDCLEACKATGLFFKDMEPCRDLLLLQVMQAGCLDRVGCAWLGMCTNVSGGVSRYLEITRHQPCNMHTAHRNNRKSAEINQPLQRHNPQAESTGQCVCIYRLFALNTYIYGSAQKVGNLWSAVGLKPLQLGYLGQRWAYSQQWCTTHLPYQHPILQKPHLSSSK